LGTYLTLELKDKSDEGIARANALWTYDNQEKGYRRVVQFRTKQDQLTDIKYMKLDDDQEHLRGKSIAQLESLLGPMFRKGVFHQKITLGDYLCSEMARRILDFMEKRCVVDPLKGAVERATDGNERVFLTEMPRNYVMKRLREKANSEHKAEDCFADCPYCKGTSGK